jgi:hypothetical protein
MDDPDATRTLYQELDETRARLCDLVRSTGADELTARPASGEWSPLENVRHLLFAEQLHFRKLLPDGLKWEAMGLRPHFMADIPALSNVGTKATTDVEEVLRTWDAVHAATASLADDDRPEVREALNGNLSHLKFHAGIIEGLLGERR